MQEIEIKPNMTDSNGKGTNLSLTLSSELLDEIDALDETKPVKIIMPTTGHTVFSKTLNNKVYNQLKRVYGKNVDKKVTWVLPEWVTKNRIVANMFSHYQQVTIK